MNLTLLKISKVDLFVLGKTGKEWTLLILKKEFIHFMVSNLMINFIGIDEDYLLLNQFINLLFPVAS